jgi:hypothetical protein
VERLSQTSGGNGRAEAANTVITSGIPKDLSLCGGVVQRSSRTDACSLRPLADDRRQAYELKWDGFRAIVSTEGTLRVRGRRGWDMTPHVLFLQELPVRGGVDDAQVAERTPSLPELVPPAAILSDMRQGRRCRAGVRSGAAWFGVALAAVPPALVR